MHPQTQVRQVDAILCRAIEIASPEEREVFIARECQGDSSCQAEVQKLVANHFQAGDFLEDPFDPIAITVDMPPEPPGTRIGHYSLLKQIGEGGFGVVYEAEQFQPIRRKVALKIIKPGMDTREVIARFEAERQALAQMDHPNIARVLDAGSTGRAAPGSSGEKPRSAGRPYFVMELVRGTHITDFCDQQTLSTRERLALFVDVCRAVQHAHQKGVIHRDLKPSNVMVAAHDGKPIPKVIDFGVSKALSKQQAEETSYNATGKIVGTPLYMSPEQAEAGGLDVDTRSDVYSLGVLLYELLTGTTPFDKASLNKVSFDEMRRMIREEEPPRPSARVSTLNGNALSTFSERRKIDTKKFSQSLRGELDRVVMKAIEKDRNQRYESASALAADVERYLNDEPVQACPPSIWYRFRKFARRRKVGFTIGTLAALLVLISAGGTALAVKMHIDGQSSALQAANSLAREEGARADAEIRQKNEIQRTLLMQTITAELRAPKDAGWPVRLWKTAREAAAIRRDSALRDVAAETVIGVDAGKLMAVKQAFPRFLAFDETGERCLFSGIETHGPTTQIWDTKTHKRLKSVNGHRGDVAFRKGQPIQLTVSKTEGLAVLAVDSGKTRRLKFDGSILAVPRLSPDGELAAACIVQRDMSAFVAVWETRSGRLRTRLPAAAATLAFSPDGSLIALGEPSGNVSVWSTETAKRLVMLPTQSSRLPVHALAFGPNVLVESPREHAAGGGKSAIGKWLLAVVRKGTLITVWDLARRMPRSHCRGSMYEVFAVAFSPDGATLASCGRRDARLWDVASGRQLLAIPQSDFHQCLAFTPDGSRLAVGAATRISRGNGFAIWQLQYGRGVRTFRGLTGIVDRIRFSPDGRLLAGLSHEWQMAVWEVKTRRLLRVFNVAPGYATDNAAIAFSHDNRRVAFSSYGHAEVWDLASGRRIKACKLPRGVDEQLAFTPSGKQLLLLRRDLEAGVVRLRNLLADQQPQVGQDLSLSRTRFVDTAAAADGSAFVVFSGGDDDKQRFAGSIACLDAAGRVRWTVPCHYHYPAPHIDLAGRTVAVVRDDKKGAELLDLQTGKPVGRIAYAAGAVSGPENRYYASRGQKAVQVFSPGRKDSVVEFAATPLPRFSIAFCPVGLQVAWGTEGGRVYVCDVLELRRRLGELKLSW